MATSVCPLLHGLPKVSVTITASLFPVADCRPALIFRALRSGSRGSSAANPLPTLDWSTPELAQTKPCLVSVMITPWPALTTLTDSRRMSSTSRGSLLCLVARALARLPGLTSARGTNLPSDLETTFCLTTNMSPSSAWTLASPIASRIRKTRSAPFLTSGMPTRGKTSMLCKPVGPRLLAMTIKALLER